jgi:hypothetical protein
VTERVARKKYVRLLAECLIIMIITVKSDILRMYVGTLLSGNLPSLQLTGDWYYSDSTITVVSSIHFSINSTVSTLETFSSSFPPKPSLSKQSAAF